MTYQRLHVKIPTKPLSSHIFVKDSCQIYGKLEQTNLLENQEMDLYRSEEEFQWVQTDLLTI